MWYWYLLIVLLAILVLWWLLTRQASFTETPKQNHQEHLDSHSDGGHPENQEVHEVVLPVEETFVEPVVETRVEPVAVSPTVPDDLVIIEGIGPKIASVLAVVIIEGIGPKIASVLAAAGISTFSELAASDPEKIRGILFATDPRLARISDPTTWPEQARLAASGDTVGLQKLQDSLKGGRQE